MTAFAAPVVDSSAAVASPAQNASAPFAGTGKRGLAFNDAKLTAGFGGPGSQVTWGYNWANAVGNDFKSGLEFVPMLWGLHPDMTNAWQQTATKAIQAGSTHLLA